MADLIGHNNHVLMAADGDRVRARHGARSCVECKHTRCILRFILSTHATTNRPPTKNSLYVAQEQEQERKWNALGRTFRLRLLYRARIDLHTAARSTFIPASSFRCPINSRRSIQPSGTGVVFPDSPSERTPKCPITRYGSRGRCCKEQ